MGGRAAQGGQPSAKRSRKNTKSKDLRMDFDPATALDSLPMQIPMQIPMMNGLEGRDSKADGLMDFSPVDDDMVLDFLNFENILPHNLGELGGLEVPMGGKKGKGKKLNKKPSSKANDFSAINPPSGHEISAILADMPMGPLIDMADSNIVNMEKPSRKVDNQPLPNMNSSDIAALNGPQSSLGRINSSGPGLNKVRTNKRKDPTKPLGSGQPLSPASPASSPSFARQKSNASQGELLNSMRSGGIQSGDPILDGRLKSFQRSESDPPIECEFGIEWLTRDAMRKEQENAESLLSSVQSHSLPGSRPASGISPSTVLGMEPGRPAPVGELPDITALYRRMQTISSSMGVSLSSSDSAAVLGLALQYHLRNIVTKCVDWAKGVRECFSIREKMDRKFGSNLLESRLDVDSATSAHRLQDSFADPRKGNARASSMNGKSIHGNPSDHRTAAVDVSNTAKVADKKHSGGKNPSKLKKDTARDLITAKDLMMVAELTGQMLGDEVAMHRERISSLL